MRKIRLRRPAIEPGGFHSGAEQITVIEWPEDSPIPPDAEEVGPGTQLHDWALPEEATAARQAAAARAEKEKGK